MTTNAETIPLQKEQSSSLFTAGFALFSMFFGAGNLIFPLLIGKSVGENWWYAILGLGITAVIVPFLGLAGMIFYKADYHRFFGRIGTIPGSLLLLLLQLILGPFGVIPRLFTLMHAILKPYITDLSLPMFSIAATIVVFLCTFKKQNIIKLLGVILTPILLLSLAGLFLSGMSYPSNVIMNHTSPTDSFLEGLLGGYNTMDLIAAFLFATVVLPYFQKDVTSNVPLHDPHSLSKKLLYSSIIAASLLLFTYTGLSYISAYHAENNGGYQSEEILGAIAVKLLGYGGSFVATIAVVTACLTTAISLTSIFADYLRKDLCKNKLSTTTALITTLSITICFANLGFTGINAFLSPILQICYPGLIVLTLLNILHYATGFKMIKTPVFLTFGASALFYFWN
jgi:LIVCS family branched-chain amino acid:cation transporter